MGEVLTKVCLGPCGLDLDLDAFGKSSDGKFGRLGRCKSCRNAEEVARRAANPSSEEQREASRQRARAWGANNKEQKATTGKAWAQANPTKMTAAARRWQVKNPERTKEIIAQWNLENPERVLQYGRDWRLANPEKFKAAQRSWRTANQHYWRVRAEAFKKVLSDFTFEQWLEVQEEHGHRCAYCLRADVKLTMDHVIAISKGGEHTRSNIVPACKSCNSRKKDRSVFWMVTVR